MTCEVAVINKRGVALAADCAVMLAQYRDDLFFREPDPLHRPSLQWGRTLNRRGGKTQWQVTPPIELHCSSWGGGVRQAQRYLEEPSLLRNTNAGLASAWHVLI